MELVIDRLTKQFQNKIFPIHKPPKLNKRNAIISLMNYFLKPKNIGIMNSIIKSPATPTITPQIIKFHSIIIAIPSPKTKAEITP